MRWTKLNVIALCRLIAVVEDPKDIREFSRPLPETVYLLERLIVAGKEDAALSILTALVELIKEENGQLFKACLDKYSVLLMLLIIAGTQMFTSLPTMFHAPMFQSLQALIQAKTAQPSPVDVDVRHMAMELLLSFCEDQPRLVRRSRTFITACVISCFTFMLSVDDVQLEAWSLQDEEDDEDSFEVGESGAFRLAGAVKGDKLAPIIVPFFSNLITVNAWQYQHAALRTISTIGIVLPFEKLPITVVTSHLAHPHPRVRYGAVQCLGQWACEFRPHMQESCHATLFPALIPSLIDACYPRLQSHTATCLMHLCDELDESIMSLYASELLECLLTLLTSSSTSHVQVQEQVMSTIAAIATSAPSLFQAHSFYDRVVALMKHVITEAKGSAHAMLRAKAMESITVVGMKVPKELFHKDACHLMHIFLDWMTTADAQQQRHQQQQMGPEHIAGVKNNTRPLVQYNLVEKSRMGLEVDDVSEQYMMQAWSRICTVLGEEFTPMLYHLLPRVFAAASQSINLTAQQDADDDETIMALETLTTSQMEEKIQALCVLNSFTHDLAIGMFPHLRECTRICLPLLSFALHPEVRMYAMSLMPLIVSSAVRALQDKRCDLPFVSQLLTDILTAMLQACTQERETKLLESLVKHLQECVVHVRDIGIAQQVIDSSGLTVLADAMLQLLNASGSRIAQKEKAMEAEEEDEDGMDEDAMLEMEMAIEAEDMLHMTIADAIGSLILSHQHAFVPTFIKLLPALQAMLSANSERERKVAVFLFDDLIEHADIGNDIALQLFPIFLPIMLRHVGRYDNDDGVHKNEPGLRQASAYGVGLCASLLAAPFTVWADPFLTKLAPVMEDRIASRSSLVLDVNESKSDETENYNDVDNVISACGKIAMMTPFTSQPNNRPYERHLDIFIRALPIVDDREEAFTAHRMLLKLVDTSHPVIDRHWSYVLFVLSVLMDSNYIDEDTNVRIKHWLSQIKQNMHADSLAQASQALSNEQRVKVAQSLATIVS